MHPNHFPSDVPYSHFGGIFGKSTSTKSNLTRKNPPSYGVPAACMPDDQSCIELSRSVGVTTHQVLRSAPLHYLINHLRQSGLERLQVDFSSWRRAPEKRVEEFVSLTRRVVMKRLQVNKGGMGEKSSKSTYHGN